MTYASVYFFIISTTDPFLITFACHVSTCSGEMLMIIMLRQLQSCLLCSFEYGCKSLDTTCVSVLYFSKCGESTTFFITQVSRERSLE